MKKNMALLVYPEFSMQEISSICFLFRWLCEQETVVFASSLKPVKSEEGLLIQPHFTVDQFCIEDYDCLILPGCSNPSLSIGDEKLITFLRQFAHHSEFLIGAICSAPMFLSKAGLLNRRKFTNSVPEPGNELLPFIEHENHVYEPVVEDGNIITAMGLAYNEFAIAIVRKLGYDCPDKILTGVQDDDTIERYRYILTDEELEEFKQAFGVYL